MEAEEVRDVTKKKYLVLFVISLVPFNMVLGNSMLVPALPVLQHEMNITSLQANLLITLFSLPAAIAIPFLGYLADKIGRKAIIVPSLLIYGAGGIICGLSALLMARPYLGMMIGRIIQGLGGAGTAPIAMTLTGDLFTDEERTQAMGINEAANGLGKVMSPILGSIFLMIKWYFLFFVYAIISIPVAIAVHFVVKEKKTDSKSSKESYFHGVLDLMKDKKWSFLSCLFAGIAVFFTLFGVLSYMSDVLETKYAIKGMYKGLLIAIPVLTMSITSFINGVIFKDKNTFKLTIVAGLTIIGTTLLISIFVKDIVWLMVIIGLMGLGAGLVLPSLNTLITSSVPLEKRGSVTAIYGSIRFIGVAIGPPIFNYLLGIGRWVMLTVPTVASFLALIICILMLSQKDMLEYRN